MRWGWVAACAALNTADTAIGTTCGQRTGLKLVLHTKPVYKHTMCVNQEGRQKPGPAARAALLSASGQAAVRSMVSISFG